MASEALNQHLPLHIDASVWRADADGRLVAVGSGLGALMGRTPGCLIGERLIPAEDIARARGEAARNAGGLQVRTAPRLHSTRDASGQKRWLRTDAFVADDGGLIGITSDSRDEGDARAEGSLRPLPLTLWTTDLQSHLTAAAPQWPPVGAREDDATWTQACHDAHARAVSGGRFNTSLSWDGGVFHIQAEPLIAADNRVAGCGGLALMLASAESGTVREIERQVRERDETLRALFDASPAAIVGISPEGRVLTWNPAAERIFGWSASEAIGQQYPAVPPENRAEFNAFLATVLTGHSISGDVVRRRKDGTRFSCRVSSAPVLGADGRINAVVGVVEDRTGERRDAEKLHQTSEALHALVEASPLAILSLDEAGRLQLWNTAAERMFGWRAPEMLGEPLRIVPAGTRASFDQLREAVRAGNSLTGVPMELEHRDGRRVEVSVSMAPLHDQQGRIRGTLALVADVGTRNRVARDLEHSLALVEATLETTGDGIVAIESRTHRITRYNQQIVQMTGLPAALFERGDLDEVIRRIAPLAADAEDFVERAAHLLAHPDQESTRMFELRDGRVFERRASPLRIGGAVVGLVLNFRDATERFRAIEELRRSEQSLRTILDGVADAIFVHAVDGTILDVNEKMLAMYGVDRERALKLSIATDYSAPENRLDELPGIWARALGGAEQAFEWNARRPLDASVFPVEVTLTKVTLRSRDAILATVRDLSARKEAERELERSLTVLDGTLQSTEDGILVIDRSGRWLKVNRRFVEMYRFPPELVERGDDDEALAHSQTMVTDPEALRESVRRLRDDPDATSDDVLEFKDGRVFERHSQPLRISGQSVGRVWSLHDVTERKRAERDLDRERRRYEDLMNSIDGIVWEMDASSGRFTFVSGQAERILGYPGREWLDDRDFWVKHMHPDDREWAPDFRASETRAARHHEFEYRMIAADGRVVWLRDIVSLVDQAGAVKLRGIMVDITARKQAQAERDRLLVDERRARGDAEQARRKAAFLAEASRIATGSLDAESILRSVCKLTVPMLADASAGDLLGPTGEPRRAAGVCDDGLCPPPAPLNVLRTGRAEIGSGAELLVQLGAPQGRSPAPPPGSSVVAPLVARGRVLGALSLVSRQPDRYRQEDLELIEELGKRTALAVDNALLYASAQESIRLRDEFLSVASHELRTPCTVLRLTVQRLLRSAHDRSEEPMSKQFVTEGMEAAERQTRRLEMLVEQLLDVSRLSARAMELHRGEVDLVEVVRAVLVRMSPDLERAHIELRFGADAPVRGAWDGERLAQVVESLLSNAIKFGRDRPIDVEVARDGDRGVLRVRDRGIGIPPERQQRIFERFVRAVSADHYGGLGLGLYIANEIVRVHGGRLDVVSAPGEGSTFTVTLPSGVGEVTLRAP